MPSLEFVATLNRTKSVKAKLDIAQGIEMYLQGESQNKISKELNISRNTLRKELQARGLNTKCHVNQYIKQANTEVSNQITKG